MEIFELLLLALALSMDAFAVSVCKGLSIERLRFKEMLLAALWFGGFQALMPVLGYYLGSAFESYITKLDHWIAFGLLSLIGVNMIAEAFSKKDKKTDSSFSVKIMLPMAVATSIDALAIGITFAFLRVNILTAAFLIGAVTFILSAVGVKIGNIFGLKYKSGAEFIGGLILIFLGSKILLEHLGIL